MTTTLIHQGPAYELSLAIEAAGKLLVVEA